MDRTPLQGVLIGGFRVETAPLQGVLNCLLASQKVVDVVAEHQLDNIQEYPLMVYPEWDTLSVTLKEKLLRYVSAGGKLLVVGPKAAKQFQDVLQVEFIGQPEMRDNGLEFAGWLGNSLSLSQEIKVKGSARPFGKYFRHWDMEGPSSVAATITPYGKGQIAALYMNIGNAWLYRSTPVVRDFLDALVQEMQPGLMSEVKGSHSVDVTLNRLGNATILNLVNAAGPHDNDKVLVFDEIPALGPLQISIRFPAKPKRVMLQPENKTLNFTYDKGTVQCTVPSLEIHEMVVIE